MEPRARPLGFSNLLSPPEIEADGGVLHPPEGMSYPARSFGTMTARGEDKSRVALGRWGERRVARHYESAGYVVLDQNWRVRGGELDLVVAKDDEIVFCEVKTRSSDRFGSGLEAVDNRKQRFLRRTAMSWLDTHDRRGRLRFDVATVSGPSIEIVEAAF